VLSIPTPDQASQQLNAAGTGYVRVFSIDLAAAVASPSNTEAWTQVGQTIWGDQAGSFFGFDVALNAEVGVSFACFRPSVRPSICLPVHF